MKWKNGDVFAEHYKLIKLLGRGSFGEVWLAKNLLADIDVAIKFYSAFDKNGISDFKEEFKLAYQLRHSNLMHLSHFDVYDQCPFLVMGYCPNGASTKLIGNVSETGIWEFIRDVSAGLAYLHSQNPPIIHQDIKPGNILIDEKGNFLITDFGISKKIDLNKQSFRGTNLKSSGTISYMSPERFKVPPVIVKAGDIWSLGMSVYEIATGQVLWDLGGCMQLDGEKVPDLGPNYSRQLSRLIQSCLALNAWERPTAKQIYEEAKLKLASPEINNGRYIHTSYGYASNIYDSHNSGLRKLHSSSEIISHNQSKDSFWNTYKDYVMWGIGAVMLFVISVFVFNWMFSPTENIKHVKEIHNEIIEPEIPYSVDSTFIDTIKYSDTAKVKRTRYKPALVKPKQNVPSKPEPKRDRELEFWNYCKQKNQIFLYNEYINKYPKGRFLNEAKKRIRNLESMRNSYYRY